MVFSLNIHTRKHPLLLEVGHLSGLNQKIYASLIQFGVVERVDTTASAA
jgi:hypothetical protein